MNNAEKDELVSRMIRKGLNSVNTVCTPRKFCVVDFSQSRRKVHPHHLQWIIYSQDEEYFTIPYALVILIAYLADCVARSLFFSTISVCQLWKDVQPNGFNDVIWKRWQVASTCEPTSTTEATCCDVWRSKNQTDENQEGSFDSTIDNDNGFILDFDRNLRFIL